MLNKKLSYRTAASTHGIKKTTLQNRVKKAREAGITHFTPAVFQYGNKYTHNQVFSAEQEAMLKKYVLHCSKIQYGMSYKQVRRFAYEYAKSLSLKYPAIWETTREAGESWMECFMRRNPDLSLRKPENTSLARATSFNPTNVKNYFDNLERALKRYNITGDKIFNLDETGVTTVLDSPKVIAQRGIKQVGQAVSAERGELVTFCAIVCANGNTIPPAFVFPRVKFKPQFLFGAPPGSLGLSAKSGWMNADLFLQVCQHIQKHSKCSVEEPIVLLLDNHESHCSLEVILYCRANGICLVTFPPHCTHKMQPLDVGLYGPFKGYLKRKFNEWMVSNPGQTINIYHIPALVNDAYMSAFTLKNITSAFAKTGIFPLCRSVYSDDDFLTSFVTDRSEHNQHGEDPQNTQNQNDISQPGSNSMKLQENIKENHDAPTFNSAMVAETSSFLSPEQVKPYPKYAPKTGTRRGRKRGRSKILTETPEKNLIESEYLERERKKKAPTIKKKIYDSESEPEIQENIVDDEESDDVSEFDQEKSDTEFFESMEPIIDPDTGRRNLTQGDFVLVRFATKKVLKHYVGKILEVIDDCYEINFLRYKKGKFIYPQAQDISTVDLEDIVMKLPFPKKFEGTARLQASLTFSVNLTEYIQ